MALINAFILQPIDKYSRQAANIDISEAGTNITHVMVL